MHHCGVKVRCASLRVTCRYASLRVRCASPRVTCRCRYASLWDYMCITEG